MAEAGATTHPSTWASSVGALPQYQLSDLDFPTAQRGWLVGTVTPKTGSATQGVILGSSDGGSNWQQEWRGSAQPFQMTSLGAENAWALASPGCASSQPGKSCPSTVLSTIDGGTTWSQLATVRSGLDQIAFSSPEVGVAGASPLSCQQPTGSAVPTCPGAVLVTTDGGKAWTVALRTADPVVAVTATAGELLAVEATVNNGITTGTLPLLVSTDQGRSWTTAGRLSIAGQLSLDLTAKLLVQPQGQLWLSLLARDSCAMHGCGTVGTWVSSDGGRSWSQELPSARSLGASDDCSDSAPASTVAASPTGTVYGLSEVNLGACSPPAATLVSWSPAEDSTVSLAQTLYSFSAFTPTGMAWPSAQIGFAASSAGVARTTDGGLDWAQIFPALAPDNAVDALGAQIAFGAGDQAFPNAVLGTTDGGRQWRVVGRLPGQVDWLDFLSSRRGYAVVSANISSGVGTSLIYRTSDGGVTWSLVGGGPPHLGGSLIGLTIFPNGTGVTVAETENRVTPCALWSTRNGGVSWNRGARIPIQRGYGCAVVTASFPWSDGKLGPGAIVEVSTHPVRETTDLGGSWYKTPNRPRLGGIQLLSPSLQLGWTENFGNSGRTERIVLWWSKNGGRSWSTPDPKGQLLPPGSNSGSPVTLSLAGPEVAWLLAAGSAWRTVDGGRSWLPAAATSTS
jgi:photosystem II stability/assembly factor-like uncharacterized protein